MRRGTFLMLRNFKFLGLTIALALVMILAACGGGDEANSDSSTSESDGDSGEVELGGKDISLPYVSWAGSVVRSHLTAKVLEDVGYNVDLKQVEAGPMWA